MDEIFFQMLLRTFHDLSAPVLTHKWAAFQWSPDHLAFMATGAQVLQPKEEPSEEGEILAIEAEEKRVQAIQRDTDQIGSFEL